MNISEKLYLNLTQHLSLGKKNDSINFFILSSGRSGSTLLRKHLILTNKIHIPPESNDWIPNIAISFIKNNFKPWEVKIKRACAILKSDPSFKYWSIDLNTFQNYLQKKPPEEQNFHGFISNLYNFHLDESKLIGDKTPFLVFHLKWLMKLFPKAKFIHILRDPKAVICSRMINFNESLETAIERWDSSTRIIHKTKFDKDRFIEIEYEKFVKNPKGNLQNILHFLSIEADYDNSFNSQIHLGDDSMPHHKEVKKSIHLNSINKWENELSEKQLKKITDRLKTNPTFIAKYS